MEKYVINRDSWHFKLIQWYYMDYSDYRFYNYTLPDDQCSYVRLLLKVIVINALLAALALGVAGIIGTLLYLSYLFPIDAMVIVGLIALIAALITVMALAARALDTYQTRRHGMPPREPGFVKSSYIAWKEKYCTPITYK